MVFIFDVEHRTISAYPECEVLQLHAYNLLYGARYGILALEVSPHSPADDPAGKA